jgi:REP element-mobilizing transposase RayT
MAVKQKIQATDGTYFITITCCNWLHLFEISNAYNYVYKWFNVLRTNGHYINGYVIMPNHLHALISFSNTGKNINTIVGNGKRFMAYDLVERLEQTGNEIILTKLSNGVKLSDKKRGKLHEVFEDSFDVKECFSKKFILQKLDYIHWNPCTGKWNLTDHPENYMHSSAGFYYKGIQGIFVIDDIMRMMDIDLSKRV